MKYILSFIAFLALNTAFQPALAQTDESAVLKAAANHVRKGHAGKRIGLDPNKVMTGDSCAEEHSCSYARGPAHSKAADIANALAGDGGNGRTIACTKAQIEKCDLTAYDVIVAFTESRPAKAGSRQIQVSTTNTGNDGTHWYFEIRTLTLEQAGRGAWKVVNDQRVLIT